MGRLTLSEGGPLVLGHLKTMRIAIAHGAMLNSEDDRGIVEMGGAEFGCVDFDFDVRPYSEWAEECIADMRKVNDPGQEDYQTIEEFAAAVLAKFPFGDTLMKEIVANFTAVGPSKFALVRVDNTFTLSDGQIDLLITDVLSCDDETIYITGDEIEVIDIPGRSIH